MSARPTRQIVILGALAFLGCLFGFGAIARLVSLMTDVIGAYLAGALWLRWSEAGAPVPRPRTGKRCPNRADQLGEADGFGATTVSTCGRISKTTGVEPRS